MRCFESEEKAKIGNRLRICRRVHLSNFEQASSKNRREIEGLCCSNIVFSSETILTSKVNSRTERPRRSEKKIKNLESSFALRSNQHIFNIVLRTNELRKAFAFSSIWSEDIWMLIDLRKAKRQRRLVF